MANLYDAVNNFNDDFGVLVLTLPLEEYLPIADEQKVWRPVFREIADTLSETGLYVRFIAIELSDALVSGVASPATDPSESTIARALSDGEQLLLAGGPQSAVDRFYTALHGRLLLLARSVGYQAPSDASITDLYKQVRSSPGSPIVPVGPRAADIDRVLAALSTIVDSLKPVRNKTTLVHPTDELLPEPEAALAINAIKALLVYFTQKK
jgi:hypothetical protein